MRLCSYLRPSFIKLWTKMQSAPAAERNKDVILDVLRGYLPGKQQCDSTYQAKVLEIASGTGRHVTYFAEDIPHVFWLPTDIDPSHLNSISAYIEATGVTNVDKPRVLDMLNPSPLSNHPDLQHSSFDLIYNANMIHISPWGTAIGLFNTAAKLLKPEGALFIYGPFILDGSLTPESNVNFDAGLKQRNPSWGIRDTVDLNKLATENGLSLEKMVDMPSNNKCLIYRKKT